MPTAVVYYSASGNSAIAARALSENLGARLVELRESRPRKLDALNFIIGGFQAVFKVRTRLKDQPWEDVSDCTELHVITPVWASKQVPAINTFLHKCDLKGKTVSLYTIQADPSDTAAPARDVLADLIKEKGGTMAASHGLTGGAPGSPADEALAQKICSL